MTTIKETVDQFYQQIESSVAQQDFQSAEKTLNEIQHQNDPEISSLFRETVLTRLSRDNPIAKKIVKIVNERDNKAHEWYLQKNQRAEKTFGENPVDTKIDRNVYFGTRCQEATLSTLEKLRSDSPPTFDDFMEGFAVERHQIAVATKTTDAHKFGSRRDFTDKNYTPLSGNYADTKKRLLSFLNERIATTPPCGKAELLPELRELLLGKEYKIYNLEDSPHSDYFVITYQKDAQSPAEPCLALSFHDFHDEKENQDTPILINRVFLSDNGWYILKLSSFKTEYERGYFAMKDEHHSDGHILHCPPPFFEKHEQTARQLYKDLLEQNDLPEEVVIEKIAHLNWLISNMMPYHRGGAAIADMAIGSLLLYRGLPLSPYKEGIGADLWALTRPLGDFTANYAWMREIPLIQNKEPPQEVERPISHEAKPQVFYPPLELTPEEELIKEQAHTYYKETNEFLTRVVNEGGYAYYWSDHVLNNVQNVREELSNFSEISGQLLKDPEFIDYRSESLLIILKKLEKIILPYINDPNAKKDSFTSRIISSANILKERFESKMVDKLQAFVPAEILMEMKETINKMNPIQKEQINEPVKVEAKKPEKKEETKEKELNHAKLYRGLVNKQLTPVLEKGQHDPSFNKRVQFHTTKLLSELKKFADASAPLRDNKEFVEVRTKSFINILNILNEIIPLYIDQPVNQEHPPLTISVQKLKTEFAEHRSKLESFLPAEEVDKMQALIDSIAAKKTPLE